MSPPPYSPKGTVVQPQAVDGDGATADGDSGTYRVEFEWHGRGSATAAVLSAVAAVEDVDPVELPPLNEVVDPDALDCLFRPRAEGSDRGDGAISFPFAGRDVTVDSDGGVEVRPVAEE